MLQVGLNVFVKERVETSAGGQAQMLFLDGSTLTIAPNTSLTLDEYVYDPDAQKGRMAASVTKGLLRFVGGKLSKDGSVALQTPSAQIAVRGGIALIDTEASGRTTATLIYGDSLRISTPQGTQQVTRPGFAVTAEPGKPPSAPWSRPRPRPRPRGPRRAPR